MTESLKDIKIMANRNFAMIGALDLSQDLLQACFVGAIVIQDQQTRLGLVRDVSKLVACRVITSPGKRANPVWF